MSITVFQCIGFQQERIGGEAGRFRNIGVWEEGGGYMET